MDRIVVKMVDTWAFHDENMLVVVVIVVVNMVNET
jgi:hypothetical protein